MESNRVSSTPRSSLRAWLPVVGLTFSAFVFNTSEFMPIGLLTDIANDFHISEAHAGLLITVYAWVVALASLPLTLMASKMELRRLLLSVIGLFIACQFLSSITTTYELLMASRVGVACAHAIFWSIVSPMAVRVAPEGHGSTALGLIVTGTSVAMIVGLPLGRMVGLYVGWRMTFLCIGAAALLAFILLACIFPKMPSRSGFSIRKLPTLIEKPALLGIYLTTILFVTGYYTAYSYIEPFLAQVAQMSAGGVTTVLTLFGLVGIGASMLFSRSYDKHPYTFIRYSIVAVTAMILLLHASSFSYTAVVALCIVWGFAVTLYNLAFQSEIIRLMPEATAIAMSIFSGIYNMGIGSGALVGGIVCEHLSLSAIGYVGGAIAMASTAYCLRTLIPKLKESREQSNALQGR